MLSILSCIVYLFLLDDKHSWIVSAPRWILWISIFHNETLLLASFCSFSINNRNIYWIRSKCPFFPIIIFFLIPNTSPTRISFLSNQKVQNLKILLKNSCSVFRTLNSQFCYIVTKWADLYVWNSLTSASSNLIIY